MRMKCTPPLTANEEYVLFKQLASAVRTIRLQEKKRNRKRADSVQLGAARKVWKINRDRIATSNMPLVIMLARRFLIPGVDFDDLIEEGAVKLMQCIDNFDAERGFRFCTYLHRSLIFGFLRVRSTENKTWQKRVNDEEDLIVDNVQSVEPENTDALIELRDVLAKNTADLSKVEMAVIKLSFEKTQHEVSLITGLSKVKIKEARDSALRKLMETMHHDET
jgi:RNA polymerase sigma factor (sigma-70 family)